MNEQRYRAWGFLSAGIDSEGSEVGLQVRRGRIAMAEGRDSVRQSIFLLLSTLPGERVMRPDYGCELHRLIFSPNDDTTAGIAIHYVRRAIEKWEPRVQVLRVDAQPGVRGPGFLDVLLVYRVIRTGETDGVSISVDLAGGA